MIKKDYIIYPKLKKEAPHQTDRRKEAEAREMKPLEKLFRVSFSAAGLGLTRNLTPSSSLDLPSTSPSQNESLLSALDSICEESVGLFQSVSHYLNKTREYCRNGPKVTYLHLYQNHLFSLGIFVLFKGGRIPLHDHPSMFGAIKVLHGELSVSSYTVMEEKERMLQVRAEAPALLNTSSPPTVLDPITKNIHEITYAGPEQTPAEDFAAFIDFLSPPYKAEQEACNYYQILERSGSPLVTMMKCPSPPSYWTEELSPSLEFFSEALVQELETKYSYSKI